MNYAIMAIVAATLVGIGLLAVGKLFAAVGLIILATVAIIAVFVFSGTNHDHNDKKPPSPHL